MQRVVHNLDSSLEVLNRWVEKRKQLKNISPKFVLPDLIDAEQRHKKIENILINGQWKGDIYLDHKCDKELSPIDYTGAVASINYMENILLGDINEKMSSFIKIRAMILVFALAIIIIVLLLVAKLLSPQIFAPSSGKHWI